MNFRKIKNIFNKKPLSIVSKSNLLFITVICSFAIIFSENALFFNWIAATFCMFSIFGNDSIQTIGIFLNSNKKVEWWKMWIFMSVFFIITILFGYFYNNYRIDFNLLENVQDIKNIGLLHFLSPVILIVLSYFKIPVSTTFLVICVFVNMDTINLMLKKTFLGYLVGFTFSAIEWALVYKFLPSLIGEVRVEDVDSVQSNRWKIAAWFSTAALWIAWIMQNNLNIAVYLPRIMTVYDLFLFMLLALMILAFVFYNRGGPIQNVVKEKKNLTDYRTIVLINFSFAVLIAAFKSANNIPMATTWMFLGILGGREFILVELENKKVDSAKHMKTIYSIFKDIALASLGIIISLLFAKLGKFL